MPEVLENVIRSVQAEPAAASVTLTWANGETTVSRLAHLAGKGVFRAFSDPAFFAQVRIGEHGRSLDWPGELDLCADALWFESQPQDAPDSALRPRSAAA